MDMILNSFSASGNHLFNPDRVAKYAWPHSGRRSISHFSLLILSTRRPTTVFMDSSSPENRPQLTPSQFSEEMVQDYLELNQLANSFWIVEISDTFDPEEYQTLVDEGERERWDRLEDYSAEDFMEILHSDDMELL